VNRGDHLDLDRPIGAHERRHDDQRARGRLGGVEVTGADFTDDRYVVRSGVLS